MVRSAKNDLFTRAGASAAALDAGNGAVAKFGVEVAGYFMDGKLRVVPTGADPAKCRV